MPKHTLFVCQSCHHSSEKPSEEQPADGTQLLERLNALRGEKAQLNEVEIQPVGCLWTCDLPCAVAFSAPHKPTYLFTTLPTDKTATALLEFGELYCSSHTGDLPWKKFPEALQSVSIAKIPTTG
ncbi:MAG: DUF1636 domain-containing protein [Kaiparowitsia implicata GSE-PSE-MK54-09C]|jgi:predicted metal-binding protein|nr:DUF1636 domain-containing protein [Kaiparowitsia implicata GSE-PSE-MK54-09C]